LFIHFNVAPGKHYKVALSIMLLSIFWYSKKLKFKGNTAQIHCNEGNPRVQCNHVSEKCNPRWRTSQETSQYWKAL